MRFSPPCREGSDEGTPRCRPKPGGGLARLQDDVEKRLRAADESIQGIELAFKDASGALGAAEDRAHANALDHDAQMALGDAKAKIQKLLGDLNRARRARDALRTEHDGIEDRLFEARQDLEAVRSAHEIAETQRLVEQEKVAAELAKSAPAREKLLARINDGFAADAAAMKAFVDAVLTLVELASAVPKSLEADSQLVTELRSLGGDDLRPRDGAGHAGALARAMHEAGATWSLSDDEVHQLRFPFDPPPSGASWNPFEKVRQLVALVTRSLETAERNAALGVAGRGRARLAQVAELFSSSRDRVEAAAKFAALSQKGVAEREEQARRAHEARLEAHFGGSTTPDAVNRRLREKSGVQAARSVPSAPSPATTFSNAARSDPNDIENEGEFHIDTVG